MFILDTNVVSELRKAGRGGVDATVTSWVARTVRESMFLSVVTVWELEIGVLRLERRNAIGGQALRRWLQTQVVPSFNGRILPVDLPVAMRCAALHVPTARPQADAFIAATALVHGMTVVTRNTADFEHTGVKLLDPWRA